MRLLPTEVVPSISPLATFLLLLLLGLSSPSRSEGYKVAIIGGGISGTFAAKYLADYDANHRSVDESGQRRDCLLDEIAVYDVSPPPAGLSDDSQSARDGDDKQTAKGLQSTADPRPPGRQGSRVSSVVLGDGSVVELGASIIYDGNRLVVDMMNGDPGRLRKSKPMGTGVNETAATSARKKAPTGLGIYHGRGRWLLSTAWLSSYPKFLQSLLKPLYLLWRYNVDYWRLRSSVKQTVRAFDLIYDLMNDTKHDVTYFQSPMEMWDAMGLRSLSEVSFHDVLDAVGICRDKSLESDGGSEGSGRSWRELLGTGCLRGELVTAMSINNYNQDPGQLNGLVGLVSFVPVGTAGDLFSIEGGNHQLMESAFHQARGIYESSSCGSPQTRVRRHQRTVSTVVASESSMELFSDGKSLGAYDVVVLAAPLQQCGIRFLIESGMDEMALHDMPLGGMHANPDLDVEAGEDGEGASSNVATNEHGRRSFAPPLPPSATVRYTSVVTTFVSNATFNASHFGLRDDEPWPRSILMSEQGKLLEGGLTTITVLSLERGLIKTYSSERLDEERRNVLFGTGHVVEYVQDWGATPDFAGGRRSGSLPYLLYDGAGHWGKGNSGAGPALYYANAVESAAAAIEISAMGAKSTAKLVARRLGLIGLVKDGVGNDEL